MLLVEILLWAIYDQVCQEAQLWTENKQMYI